MKPILVTGGEGLVGASLLLSLHDRRVPTIGLDLVGTECDRGDVRDPEHVRRAIEGCAGVVHLAAISRVITGELDPESCRQTNIGGLRNVLEEAERQREPPWVVFASSREVYGQALDLPATEDTPLAPVNVYGRSKVEGERMIAAARARGLRAVVVRLSSVYGSTRDHADRVVPAFARAAVGGGRIRVDGFDHSFDFTHIDDTTTALVGLVDLLQRGGTPPPPIHVVTVEPTTLRDLATMAVELAGTAASIVEAPPRSFDVSRFVGSPTRARETLGWVARVRVRDGVARLVADFRREAATGVTS